MNHNNKTVSLVLSTAAVMALFVSAEGARAACGPSSPAVLAAGKAAYMTNCLTCHGEKGDGQGDAGKFMNPKPRNFAIDDFKVGKKKPTPADVFKVVTEGLPNTAMVAYAQLSEADRCALSHYVLSMRPAKK